MVRRFLAGRTSVVVASVIGHSYMERPTKIGWGIANEVNEAVAQIYGWPPRRRGDS
jgi:hypothetical protein